MRRHFFIIYILLISTSLAPIFGQKQPIWDYRFPLDITAVISGSFGELRANHFHSGVDFATQGKTGLPIYAADDGHVSRIAVSPLGYGKALYIEHPNGYSTVYAHIHDFSPKIETIVNNLQYEKEAYAFDQYFKPGELVVKKGELIAYAGNSGSSGGPHLHFEIRETEQQKPVNPHFFNLPVKDDVPPHIEAICIYPLDENSRINGKNAPLYLPAIKNQGKYLLKGNPRIAASGTIGVGIETLDYFTGSWRKCGVYSTVLFLDGKNWFESKLDGFLFSQTRYLNSHIDYAMRQKNKKVIQKSFLDENNHLEIYKVTSEKGRIKMNDGDSKELRYDVADAAGNISKLSFTIHGAKIPVQHESSATYKPVLNASKTYSTEIDGFKVKFPANSFYTDVPASFKVSPNTGVGFGSHFSVLDPSIPIHNFFEVYLPIAKKHTNKKGLVGARLTNENGLVFAGGTRDGEKWVINTRDPGVYCLSADSIAPTIRLLQLPQNRNYAGRDAIRVELKDNFSGIKEFRCTINGSWALFEFDPKNNVIIGFFRKLRIEKGSKHALEITATDQAGNVQTLKTNFVY
jgi:murein DD-endopeptidase MepM/ murein hydrolase activator NlpD